MNEADPFSPSAQDLNEEGSISASDASRVNWPKKRLSSTFRRASPGTLRKGNKAMESDYATSSESDCETDTTEKSDDYMTARSSPVSSRGQKKRYQVTTVPSEPLGTSKGDIRKKNEEMDIDSDSDIDISSDDSFNDKPYEPEKEETSDSADTDTESNFDKRKSSTTSLPKKSQKKAERKSHMDMPSSGMPTGGKSRNMFVMVHIGCTYV